MHFQNQGWPKKWSGPDPTDPTGCAGPAKVLRAREQNSCLDEAPLTEKGRLFQLWAARNVGYPGEKASAPVG